MDNQTLQNILNWLADHYELVSGIYRLINPILKIGYKRLKSAYIRYRQSRKDCEFQGRPRQQQTR